MTYRHFEINPITPTIGATISGIDLNNVRSDDVYEDIQRALWQYGVVFFRKQPLTPENYIKLGSKFGEMEVHKFFPHIEGHPQIQLIDHQGHEAPETDRWHADVTFRAKPNLVSILRLTHLPPQGGDTMWASAAAAYDALGPEMQSMLLQLNAEHDMPFHFRRINALKKVLEKNAGTQKGGMMSSLSSADEMQASLADAECKLIKDNPLHTHPAVITHPYNQRRILYVNSI